MHPKTAENLFFFTDVPPFNFNRLNFFHNVLELCPSVFSRDYYGAAAPSFSAPFILELRFSVFSRVVPAARALYAVLASSFKLFLLLFSVMRSMTLDLL